MFTGIVQAVGRVVAMTPKGGDVELLVDTTTLGLETANIGDSIAVAGACLTATRFEGTCFAADVSNETLACTTLGSLAVGSPVNLEKALCAGQPLGGHYVTGHVDGVGEVVSTADDGRSWRVVFRVPPQLARYIAPKGSVTVEGVSLTVNEVAGDTFGVNLVPHTREVTTLGALVPGRPVNLEADIIARYLERLVGDRALPRPDGSR